MGSSSLKPILYLSYSSYYVFEGLLRDVPVCIRFSAASVLLSVLLGHNDSKTVC